MGTSIDILNPAQNAHEARELALSGNSKALAAFAAELSTDTWQNSPGQIKATVADYTALETSADKQLLPQLEVVNGGKGILVVGPKTRPDAEVCGRQSEYSAIQNMYQEMEQFAPDSPKTDSPKDITNFVTAEKGVAKVRKYVADREEQAMDAQLNKRDDNSISAINAGREDRPAPKQGK